MHRSELNDLQAFATVADEKSFTRAAIKLGLSASALSHAMKTLEERIGMRLLARTTRSVATTEAGERLLRTLRPALAEIASELTALGSLRDRPAGTVRLTTFKHAATSVVMPALPELFEAYPDVRVEIVLDDDLVDLVAERFDAGIRWPDKVEKDMVAVTVGKPVRLAVVGSPDYFATHPRPKTPRDLVHHLCINYRQPGSGRVFPWEFERDGRTVHAKVDGPFTASDGELGVRAALDGVGLAMYYDDEIAQHVDEGRLVRVLGSWCPPSGGYQIYYPDRRHVPPALAALIGTLRRRVRRRGTPRE